jgi:transcriptional regulator with XRE-family HTH domain
MNAEQWFTELIEAGENDPDSLTDELVLDISEQISVRMQQCGVRSAELAHRLGVSRSYISQLLSGKPNMTMRTLVGVAHALGQRVQIELRDHETVDELDSRRYLRAIPVLVMESDNAIALAS